MKLIKFALVAMSTLSITSAALAKSSACRSMIPGATAKISCEEVNGGSRSVCLYGSANGVIVQMRGDDQYNGIFEETLQQTGGDKLIKLVKKERTLSTYSKTVVIIDDNGDGSFENTYRHLNVFDNENVHSEFNMTCVRVSN